MKVTAFASTFASKHNSVNLVLACSLFFFIYKYPSENILTGFNMSNKIVSSTNDKEIEIQNRPSENYFDLRSVHVNFAASLIDDGDIALSTYLIAYKELQKFCHLMGSVFGFVGSEIGSKMEILEELLAKNKSSNFSTMKEMILYEINNGLLKDGSYISGSRTLLRLHRGLDFLRQFLKRMGELQPQDKTNSVGQEVYNQTLAKHHSWLVRKGALVAMYVLPTREALLHRVCGEDTQSILDALPDMLESTNEVYNRTELFFKEKDLLNLP